MFSFSKCSLFHNSIIFGSCIIHILYTGCAKIKKNFSPKRLKILSVLKYNPWNSQHYTKCHLHFLSFVGSATVHVLIQRINLDFWFLDLPNSVSPLAQYSDPFPTCRYDQRCRHVRMSVQHFPITQCCFLSYCLLSRFSHQTPLLIDLNSAELRYELLRNIPNVQRLYHCTPTCTLTQQPKIS